MMVRRRSPAGCRPIQLRNAASQVGDAAFFGFTRLRKKLRTRSLAFQLLSALFAASYPNPKFSGRIYKI